MTKYGIFFWATWLVLLILPVTGALDNLSPENRSLYTLFIGMWIGFFIGLLVANVIIKKKD